MIPPSRNSITRLTLHAMYYLLALIFFKFFSIKAVKERLSRPPPSQPPPSGDSGTTGGLAKSRSWQGFSAAHRTSRQQAFWEAERYESTSEKDLSLPPPPDKVPEAVNKRLHSSKSPNRYIT